MASEGNTIKEGQEYTEKPSVHGVHLREGRKSDLERLVDINHEAMITDPLYHWMELYTSSSEDENTREAVSNALDSETEDHVVVIAVPGADDESYPVGFCHFFEGYITLPAKSTEADPVAVIEQDEGRVARLRMGEEMYTLTRNFYRATIHGQKHRCKCQVRSWVGCRLSSVEVIRRLMVDPKYQRLGLGAKMLAQVANGADQMRMPMWLYSRPAGVAMYKAHGFQIVGETQLDVPEFKVSSISMLETACSHQHRCPLLMRWCDGQGYMPRTGRQLEGSVIENDRKCRIWINT
jgi:GNAT superfamily N-acetyltransferase